jgi:hypothetical protein
MIRRTYPHRSLVEVLLPDGDKLWDHILRQIDTPLEDEELLDHFMAALSRRHPTQCRAAEGCDACESEVRTAHAGGLLTSARLRV